MRTKIEVDLVYGYMFYAHNSDWCDDFHIAEDDWYIKEYAETLEDLMTKTIDEIFDTEIDIDWWCVYKVNYIIDHFDNIHQIESTRIDSCWFDFKNNEYYKQKIKEKEEKNKQEKLQKELEKQQWEEEKEKQLYESLKKKFEKEV